MGAFWPLPHGHTGEAISKTLVQKEGLLSYFSRLIVNSPLSIDSSARRSALPVTGSAIVYSFSDAVLEVFLGLSYSSIIRNPRL
jgi:hypothetical protein